MIYVKRRNHLPEHEWRRSGNGGRLFTTAFFSLADTTAASAKKKNIDILRLWLIVIELFCVLTARLAPEKIEINLIHGQRGIKPQMDGITAKWTVIVLHID